MAVYSQSLILIAISFAFRLYVLERYYRKLSRNSVSKGDIIQQCFSQTPSMKQVYLVCALISTPSLAFMVFCTSIFIY